MNDEKHITTVNKAMLNKTLEPAAAANARLPAVCMQNFLHCRQPGL